MSRINYNPNAVKEIEAWEPVVVSVADEIAHVGWAESCRDPEYKERHSKRWRRSGIELRRNPGRYDSEEYRSEVYFDNKAEALAYLRETLLPLFRSRVEAGTYTALAGKTKPGFSDVNEHAGLDPEHPNGDDFWDAYFNYVVWGKVNTRNSYAWKRKQYVSKWVPAFALRVEKVTLTVPA